MKLPKLIAGMYHPSVPGPVSRKDRRRGQRPGDRRWFMGQILTGIKARKKSYQIPNSLLFRGGQCLSRTPSVAGDRQKFTISMWARRGTIGARQDLFSWSQDVPLAFLADDTLQVFLFGAVALKTTRVFRDPNAWTHIVLVVDSTSGTANHRVRLYINGVEETAFSTRNNPAQNALVNGNRAGEECAIGKIVGGTNYFSGQAAEPLFVDGSNPATAVFGEFDPAVPTNWRPKKVAGITWGTNGSYLGKPWNAASLGTDYSGQGNNWTPTGFAATDVLTDSPTSVYATLNPLDGAGSQTFSAGNLAAAAGGAWAVTRATLPLPTTGKWAWKTTYDTAQSGSAYSVLGLVPVGTAMSATMLSTTGNKGVFCGVVGSSDMQFTYNNAVMLGTAWSPRPSAGTWYEWLFDADAKTLTLKSSAGTTLAALDLSSYGVTQWAVAAQSYSSTVTFDFGQRGYAPPAGYKTICIANLPAPTSPAARQPWKYYSCQLVSHNGTSTNFTVGWNPDPANGGSHTLFRLKSLGAASWHYIDTVRGLNKGLIGNSTSAEFTDAAMLSVAANGTVTILGSFPAATYLVEAWRVAPEAGLDIVLINNNPGSAGMKLVDHNNGSTPGFVTVMTRNYSGNNHHIYHSSFTSMNDYLHLNTTSGKQTAGSPVWSMSATQVGFNTWANTDCVAYVWSPVPGFSAFGPHTGNASTDGPFDWLGFVQGEVTLKRTDTSGYDWREYDAARSPTNVVNKILFLNSNAAEQGNDDMDFTAGGLKIRANSVHINAGTVIYAAWAKAPLGATNITPATAR